MKHIITSVLFATAIMLITIGMILAFHADSMIMASCGVGTVVIGVIVLHLTRSKT